ncbi:MAG: hypothetical protein ACM319_00315 [Deltaproteobacteria bacterium]
MFGEPGKWHCAHTAAFPVSAVVVWVYVEPAEARQGLAECGASTPWQVKHDTCEPPPEKPTP